MYRWITFTLDFTFCKRNIFFLVFFSLFFYFRLLHDVQQYAKYYISLVSVFYWQFIARTCEEHRYKSFVSNRRLSKEIYTYICTYVYICMCYFMPCACERYIFGHIINTPKTLIKITFHSKLKQFLFDSVTRQKITFLFVVHENHIFLISNKRVLSLFFLFIYRIVPSIQEFIETRKYNFIDVFGRLK